MSEAARAIIEEVEATGLENVEFIGQALKDPLNVLRLKLKEMGELSADSAVAIRRIIVITDYNTDEGRSVGIMFSEGEHESEEDAEDAVLAVLTKLQVSMALD